MLPYIKVILMSSMLCGMQIWGKEVFEQLLGDTLRWCIGTISGEISEISAALLKTWENKTQTL